MYGEVQKKIMAKQPLPPKKKKIMKKKSLLAEVQEETADAVQQMNWGEIVWTVCE